MLLGTVECRVYDYITSQLMRLLLVCCLVTDSVCKQLTHGPYLDFNLQLHVIIIQVCYHWTIN